MSDLWGYGWRMGPEPTARLAMPAQHAYDDYLPHTMRRSETPPAQGEFFHGTDQEHQPGDILESTRSRYEREPEKYKDRMDYYETGIGSPSQANWVWMHNHPSHTIGYGKNVYQVEPMDEGPWPWNGPRVDSWDGRLLDDDEEDDPDQEPKRYVSPRARVIRKLDPNPHTGEYTLPLDDDHHTAFRLGGANGDLPENLHFREHRGWTHAYDGEHLIGYLRPAQGKIDMIKVHPEYRRQGIGTAMLDWHRNNVDPDLGHSTDQTPLGRAWGRSVGWNPPVWNRQDPDIDTLEDYEVERGPHTAARLAMPAPLPQGVTFQHHPNHFDPFPAVHPDDPVPPPGHKWVQFHEDLYDEDEPAEFYLAAPQDTAKGTQTWHVRGADNGHRYDPEELLIHDRLPSGVRAVTPTGSWPTVSAHHGDRTVGYLQWNPDPGPDRGRIENVQVHPDYQRRGIGLALFDLAKQHEPHLRHSENLSEDGKGWRNHEQNRNARLAMPTYYHHTDDPDFHPDPERQPTSMSQHPGGPGIFLTPEERPDMWKGLHGGDDYRVEFHADDDITEHPGVWSENYGLDGAPLEIFVPGDQMHHLTVKNVHPRKARTMTAAVTVYTKPNCPQCTMTKKQLDRLGIEHRVIDVTVDPDAHAYVTGLGYQQAPVVVVGDGENHWGGFSPDKLKGLVE